MKRYVIVSNLEYGVAIDKNKEDAIIENVSLPLLESTNESKTAGIAAMKKNKTEVGFIKCYKNPIYSSFTSMMDDITFVGVLDNYKRDIHCLLTEAYKGKLTSFLENKSCVPVFPDFTQFNYEPRKYAHYLKYLAFTKEWDTLFKDYDEKLMYNDFVNFNKSYFSVLKDIIGKDDKIVIMSPELWLLPSMFDDDVDISVALLIPFFRVEFFKCLYNNIEILKSLLKAHLVFQNQCEKDLFLEVCAINIPNFDKGLTSTQVKAIGIDLESIEKIKSSGFKDQVAQIKNRYSNKKIIVTILNTVNSELSENVLIAFNSLLSTEEVVLIQVEHHSNQLEPEKKVEISKGINFIRTTHGNETVLTITPTNDKDYYSFLAAADLGLFLFDHSVTNKSCCDFIAVNDAPVILSCNSFNSFSSLCVNPNDSNALLSKIKEGLSQTKNMNAAANQKILENMKVKNFVHQIESPHFKKRPKAPKKLDEEKILTTFEKSKNGVLVLDYDGTLREIVKNPSDATVTSELQKLLDHLVAIKNLTLVIATERSKEEADGFFPDPRIVVYAEHSAFYRKNGNWETRDIDLSWKELACQIINEYVESTPGTKIEIKNSTVVFHYRYADEAYRDEQAERCRKSLIQALKETANVKVGKCIVEVNAMGIGKDYVIDQFHDACFRLCAGDDTTDEKMFEAQDFISIVIGNKMSRAEYFVETPQDFRDFLKKF